MRDDVFLKYNYMTELQAKIGYKMSSLNQRSFGKLRKGMRLSEANVLLRSTRSVIYTAQFSAQHEAESP